MAAIARLRHLATIRNSNVDKKSLEGEQTVRLCNYTDVYYSDRIDESSDFMEATATLDEIDRFTLRESQVLMTKDSETTDDIGIPAYVPHDMPGLICGYHLTQITPGDGLSGRLLTWSLMSRKLRAWFEVSARGVTRFSLGQDAINNAPVPASTIPVQRQIADFLDRETARIDALVDKKQRLIDLLEEKLTATITHAVTKGLDPTVPMKESGIPWIGEIPMHWEIGALKRWWSVTDCLHRTATYVEEGVPLVGTVQVRPGRLSLAEARMTTPEEYEALAFGDRRPRRGDIIYSRNASLGAAAYVDTDQRFAMGQDVCLIRSRAQDQLFLSYFMRSRFAREQVDAAVVGATFKRINVDQIKAFWVVKPPIDEQVSLARSLDGHSDAIDRTLTRLAAQLSLLAEYREALIAAAVTGEIDVESFDAEREVEAVAG